MSYTVLSEYRGAARLLTLNRPDKLNAINSALNADLSEALAAAHPDDGVAAVVLAGSGCARVMASDIVVAGENASFGYPEVKRGLAATAEFGWSGF